MNPIRKIPLDGRFHFDRLLVVVCSCLLLFGFVMVASASLHLGVKSAGDAFYYPSHQLLHMGLGLVLGIFVAATPMRLWERWGGWLFIFGLFLLIVVLIPGLGITVNGSTRWLSLGGLRVQVSEVTKFCSVIYMAGYVTRHQQTVQESAFGLLNPLILFSIACVLLLLEPDFGSSVVILMIAMGVMFLAGARLWQFGILLGSMGLLLALLVLFSPYRLKRVTSFMDPWADPLGSGFQLTHALISFGRGEWSGVGLGSGVQKLFYLPEAHTDFIFSVIAEELGLVGVISVIILFALLIWRIFQIGAQAEQIGQRFWAFVAYGLGIWFGFQSFVNMGVNMGLLPTKGLTLPLISYGGGSMMIMCCAVALLFRLNSEIVEYNTIALNNRGRHG